MPFKVVAADQDGNLGRLVSRVRIIYSANRPGLKEKT